MKFFDKILDLIYPKSITCNVCGDDIFDGRKSDVCDKCESILPHLSGKLCIVCSNKIDNMADVCDYCINYHKSFDKAFAIFEYRDSIAAMIRKFKFENAKYLKSTLVHYLTNCYTQNKLECDVITCVPITDKRLKTRKYNQSAILASGISKNIDVQFNDKILVKTRETKSQVDLNFADRKKNLVNAFKVKSRMAVMDKVVLLVDDVYTTGATVNECATKLKKAGASKVYVLTVAHTIFKHGKE